MIRTITNNADLLKVLSERKDVMGTLIHNTELDDSDLCTYNRFMNWYNNLSQLDKDIFYLLTQRSVGEIAKLLNTSVGYVYNKKRELEKSRCKKIQ